jgi:DNA polymerase-4
MSKFDSVSPRLVAHADMDAFYASVEQMDNPELRGKPILVGSPGGRGVVLTASYEARPFKVGSAMPMARARKMCPQAIIMPPRFERYTEISKQIMEVFRSFSPSIEAISLDEAFIDLTGAESLLGQPREIGLAIKEAVREATGGLTVSVGISATKFVAKVASDYQKPDGLTIVPGDEAQTWLAPMPVKRLWGAGPVTVKKLEVLWLETIGDVAACDLAWLEQKLGRMGVRFHALAHAQDPRGVEGRSASKSIGSERTLLEDISDPERIMFYLRRAAEQVGQRLRRKDRVAWGVQVKLKTHDFRTLSRQHRRDKPTDLAESLYKDGCALLEKFGEPGPFRLVGLAAYDIEKAGDEPQGDLFSQTVGDSGIDGVRHRHDLEVAIDDLKEKFGADILKRADDLSRTRQTPNLDFLAKGDEEED